MPSARAGEVSMRRCTRAISRSTGVSSSTAARMCAAKCRRMDPWKRTVRMRRETRTRARCVSQRTVEHHAERAVSGVQERRDDLEPLQGTGLALALAGPDGFPQARCLGLQVEVADPLLDGLGAHTATEVAAEPVPHLAVEQLVAFEGLNLEAAEPVPDLLDPVDLTLSAIPDLLALPVRALPDLAPGVTLGPGRLQLSQILLQLGLPGTDVVVAALLDLVLLDRDLRLK